MLAIFYKNNFCKEKKRKFLIQVRKSEENYGYINNNSNLREIQLKTLYAVEFKKMLSNIENWSSKTFYTKLNFYLN